MKMFDLPCLDSRKSFYGKAKVIEDDDKITLISYNTPVCEIVNGEFRKIWNGHSMTTTRHINSFLKFYNITK